MALFADGSPEFVPAIRESSDADKLAEFAASWYADTRPVAREYLAQYLEQPLNAVRHEPLVKRLFKLAENAGDDIAMAWFLVALDRSARRRLVIERRYRYENTRGWGREVQVEEVDTLRNTLGPMPKHDWSLRQIRSGRLKTDRLRLFSTKTRNYLRRRAWRYFRKLGRKDAERYLHGISQALVRYRDEDIADGLALLDNWGMVHALFHFSPALKSRPSGWTVAEGHSLAELAPAPMFNAAWQSNPSLALELLDTAQCRPVRQWAIRWLERESPQTLDLLPVEKLIDWIARGLPDLAEFAIHRLRNASGLERIPVEQWLALIETSPEEILDLLCELVERHVTPDRLSLLETVRLAKLRPTPIARLALAWLRSKRPTTEAEVEALLSLREAPAEPVRPDLARFAAFALSESPQFQSNWVLEFLDSRHDDVRRVGWDWLEIEPRAKDDLTVWQKLLESPYDDVRLKMVERLERISGLSSDLGPVRLLWATVLLNIHRGGRTKTIVVRQLVERLARHPEDATELLPLLAVALRSTRGVEFRSGLTAIVQLLDRRPELAAAVEASFPEFRREALV